MQATCQSVNQLEAARRACFVAKILFQILYKNQQFQAELATVKAAEWTTPPSPPPTPKDPVNPFREP